MMNIPFKKGSKEIIKNKEKLWSQIFAISMKQNSPILNTVLILNEEFEEVYNEYSERKVVFYFFDKLGINYIPN